MVERGLYISFFDEGVPPERHLPAVGPLVGVVVRDHELLAERKIVAQADHREAQLADLLVAELEFQRATGELPGGARRNSIRITAPDGVYLRFVTMLDSFGGMAQRELGPFASVLVLPRAVVADGVRLARRTGLDATEWELTAMADPVMAGARESDIAFRGVGMAYHSAITAAPVPLHSSPSVDLAWPEPPR